MKSVHEQILAQFELYLEDSEKFETNGNGAAGTRARKALNEIGKLTKLRRKEIQDTKNSA